MKIQFCDLCNESVPQSDLDFGLAFVRKGRVICSTCDRAMSHDTNPHGADSDTSLDALAPVTVEDSPPDLGGSPGGVGESMETARIDPLTDAESAPGVEELAAPVAQARPGAHALWTAITALCLCAGGLALLIPRIHRGEARVLELERALHDHESSLTELSRAQREVPALRRSMAQDLEKGLAAGREENAGLKSELAAQAKALGAEIEALKAALEVARRNAQEGRLADRRELTDMSARLASSEEEAQQLRARLAEIGTRLESSPAEKGGAGPVDSHSSAEEGWKAVVPDLASPNAGTRWQAVDALGQSRDPLAAAHVIPMLQDSDVFVRMAAARVLGELRATNAIKPLIDALEDVEPAVREAAHFALCAITGRDQRFDAHASDPERAKRVKAWRDWWKTMEGESGGSSG